MHPVRLWEVWQMSASRKRKKAARRWVFTDSWNDGTRNEWEEKSERWARHEKMNRKRRKNDDAYLISQNLCQAPVKYAKCYWCLATGDGYRHHPPSFFYRGMSRV